MNSENSKNDQDWVSADDLMDRLNSDPEYQKKINSKEARRKERLMRLRKDSVSLEGELKLIGINKTLIDLSNSTDKIGSEVISVLLRYIDRCQEIGNKEMIVRALAGATEAFDGSLLIKNYEIFRDFEGFRFAILATIAVTRPFSIDDWIAEMSSNPYFADTLRKLGYKPGIGPQRKKTRKQ